MGFQSKLYVWDCLRCAQCIWGSCSPMGWLCCLAYQALGAALALWMAGNSLCICLWANTARTRVVFEKHRRRGLLSPSAPSFPRGRAGCMAPGAFWCFCCELLPLLCRTNEQCETLAARVQWYGCVCPLSVRFQLTAAALDGALTFGLLTGKCQLMPGCVFTAY